MRTFIIKPSEIEGAVGERNEYSLFRWLSGQFNGSIVLEVGTLDGRGANALAHNPNNLVITLDRNTLEETGEWHRIRPLSPNVISMVGDVHEIDLTWVSKVDLIYLDILHAPEELDKFLKRIEPHFKGILIVDATNSRRFQAHKDYFNNLDREKHQLDLSISGCRGTGVIPYGDWTITIEGEDDAQD